MTRPKLPALAREVGTFAAIGVVSTLAYAVLFLALRTTLNAQASNAIALLVTAVGNTAANRRLTFGVRERDGLGRDHLGGLVAFGVALTVTSSSVAALHAIAPAPPRYLELAVLIGANGLATLLRFVILRAWIARGRRPSQTAHTREALS